MFFFGSVYLVLYSICLFWMISPSSGSRSFSWEVVVLYDLTFHVKHPAGASKAKGRAQQIFWKPSGARKTWVLWVSRRVLRSRQLHGVAAFPVVPGRSLSTHGVSRGGGGGGAEKEGRSE